MKPFIDAAYISLNKHGEELCGDKVEIIRRDEDIIAVLADGLGSGVKANILATLTSKIASTMLMEGEDIVETVDTLVKTLPVCKVRKLAYSTFTMMRIEENGNVYAAEYDNPPIFYLRNGKRMDIEKRSLSLNNKTIKESSFTLESGDALVIVSDGVVHAGVGAILNLGWQYDNVMDYLENAACITESSNQLAHSLIDVCDQLYAGEPGDDTTALVIRMRPKKELTLFAGPPENPEDDKKVVDMLINSDGKKVVCGGTASNIVARETGRSVRVSLDYADKEIPPIGYIKGIDLVTEGVLTIRKATEKLREYKKTNRDAVIQGRDGASKLANILVSGTTHVNIISGKAVNPAHQNPGFPKELLIKARLLDELCDTLNELGIRASIQNV